MDVQDSSVGEFNDVKCLETRDNIKEMNVEEWNDDANVEVNQPGYGFVEVVDELKIEWIGVKEESK